MTFIRHTFIVLTLYDIHSAHVYWVDTLWYSFGTRLLCWHFMTFIRHTFIVLTLTFMIFIRHTFIELTIYDIHSAHVYCVDTLWHSFGTRLLCWHFMTFIRHTFIELTLYDIHSAHVYWVDTNVYDIHSAHVYCVDTNVYDIHSAHVITFIFVKDYGKDTKYPFCVLYVFLTKCWHSFGWKLLHQK